MERGKATGEVRVDKVGGKSVVTKCFSKYPLKFIIPTKAAPCMTDSVWIYTLSYGGGIVSGDIISYGLCVGDGCTTVLTTQASTKVYKSLGSKCSKQLFQADIGNEALLAVIPDPVTCFSTARYSQKQLFRVAPSSSLVLVDWITSGRHDSGEVWDFDLYKSTNNILSSDEQPLFLDTVLLEQGGTSPLVERMRDYRVIAMVVLLGTKLSHIQNQIQESVKRMMSEQLHGHSYSPNCQKKSNLHKALPPLVASCSAFGPKGVGLVVRIVAVTTELVYSFLQHQLRDLEPLIGRSPYCGT